MKGIATLIRLRKQRLDEMRVALAEIERKRDQLIAAARHLEEEFKAEQKTAAASLDASLTYSGYAAKVAEWRVALANETTKLGAEIERAGEAVVEAYRELKKYEVNESRREARVRAESERRERQNLDEIALDTFRRRQ